jgi:hypothetical protein
MECLTELCVNMIASFRPDLKQIADAPDLQCVAEFKVKLSSQAGLVICYWPVEIIEYVANFQTG